MEATRFKTSVWKRSLFSQGTRIWALTCAKLEELGCKVDPSFIGYKHSFSTPIQESNFARFKTSIPN